MARLSRTAKALALPRRVSPEPIGREATLASEPVPRDPASLRIIAGIAVVAAMWWAQVVLIPIVLSVLVSYALEPMVARLQELRLPRPIAVAALLLLLLAIAAAGGRALGGEAASFLDRLPSAAHTIAEGIQRTTRGTPGTVARVQQAARELEAAASKATKKTATQDGVTAVRIEEPTFKWSDWFWQGSHGAIEVGGQLLASFFLVYYLLIAGDMYKRKLVRMVPTLSDKKLTLEILAEIDRQIERFLLARIGVSVIIGASIWLSFRLLGLQEAAVWGVLAAVLFTVPFFGPTLILICACIAAFLQFGSIGMTAAVAAICLAIAAIEGNLLAPWMMSRAGEMNAVAVFASLLFWGWLWGVWGLLIAVPMTAVIKAVCERVPDFNGFAELLKG